MENIDPRQLLTRPGHDARCTWTLLTACLTQTRLTVSSFIVNALMPRAKAYIHKNNKGILGFLCGREPLSFGGLAMTTTSHISHPPHY